MKPTTVTISTFKARCLALLAKVKRTGQPLVVTRHGEPIAQILPPPSGPTRTPWLGSFESTGRIVGDIIAPAAEPRDWEALHT
ncbi:MAG: type II toxin-antitoxin system Phd/YefM family antitoxin [Gemmatimonadetes bacterium]|nr:type II toxin-antitoxin system Phd/YefM family antitoxin [Gemmatimonadota bacterium]